MWGKKRCDRHNSCLERENVNETYRYMIDFIYTKYLKYATEQRIQIPCQPIPFNSYCEKLNFILEITFTISRQRKIPDKRSQSKSSCSTTWSHQSASTLTRSRSILASQYQLRSSLRHCSKSNSMTSRLAIACNWDCLGPASCKNTDSQAAWNGMIYR